MFTFGRISRCLRHVSMSEDASRGGRGALQVVARPSTLASPRRNAIDRMHSTTTLHIDRGTGTRAAIHRQLFINAT